MAEYDALAGLNQLGGIAKRQPTSAEEAGNPGHGCGHNCIAAGVVGAAIDLYENKELRDQAKAEHTKRLNGATYKCPIPEGVWPRAINQL